MARTWGFLTSRVIKAVSKPGIPSSVSKPECLAGEVSLGDPASAFTRRRFIKLFALGAAVSTVPGKRWENSLLADITPSNVGLLRVKISDFPALQENLGSIRLGINPIEDPNGPIGFFYPIIINRASESLFYALDSGCRHAGCVVPVFDRVEGAIRCLCHGSGYGIDGGVLNGPTVSPLIRFPITFDGNDTLTIQVPNLGYRVNSSTAQNGGTQRIRLLFPTFDSVEYEVKFREKFSDEWSVVLFSLSLDGPADQISIVGDSFPATIYVDRAAPTGFYVISIRIIDLTES
jgi:nitrite reductase/ring-hydroxylating ferredoxin subunit